MAGAAVGVSGCGDDGGACDWDGSPFGAALVRFEPGPGAGFGEDALPCVVLGPPVGGGETQQGLDVLSLGVGGEIVLRLGLDAVDGPGADLLVFENAFRVSGGAVTFAEPGEVAVSADGVDFLPFPCDPEATDLARSGCAGVRPVLAPGPDGAVDPTDPAVAGGDAFDLADVGVDRARYVRIRDAGVSNVGPDTRGFDLDAVAVVP